MIAGDDNFDWMGKGLQPVQLFLYIGGGARIGEIASMDENITGWHVHYLVVRVRDAHHAY